VLLRGPGTLGDLGTKPVQRILQTAACFHEPAQAVTPAPVTTTVPSPYSSNESFSKCSGLLVCCP
jgi:hypothetical protein